MHDFNTENSVRALGHFWSEAMVHPTLSALSDLKLSQASPPAPSTPLKQWALFQLDRQSTNKAKFMKSERSDISSAALAVGTLNEPLVLRQASLKIRVCNPGALLPFLSALCSQTCLQRHLLTPDSKESRICWQDRHSFTTSPRFPYSQVSVLLYSCHSSSCPAEAATFGSSYIWVLQASTAQKYWEQLFKHVICSKVTLQKVKVWPSHCLFLSLIPLLFKTHKTFQAASDQRLTQAGGKQYHPGSSSLECNILWRYSGILLPGSHPKIPNLKRKLIQGAGQEKEKPVKFLYTPSQVQGKQEG